MIGKAQDRIQTLLTELTASGQEHGLQVAAYLDGELVVNAWAGMADPDGHPVEETTLFPVFSTSKGITATVIHLLVAQGKLSYDARVTEYWPEFAVNGKDAITVRHLLTHSAGLPYLPNDLDYAVLADWDAFSALLAQFSPAWVPGTKMEYHAVTFGNLLGEVARRVDGRPFGQLVRDLIAQPLGIEAMYMGIPDEVEPRVAFLEDSNPPPVIDDSIPQAVPGFMWPLHAMMNRPDARRACLPASGGIMSAHAIARHYAALLPGGVDGVELLPPEIIRQATQQQFPDGWAGGELPMRIGLGYALDIFARVEGSNTTFGTGGFGGSVGFADTECRLAVGFTKNFFNPSGCTPQILQALREALQQV